ncbi:acyl-CoA thioesterase [Candidatus Marinimicrobia bacterium]|nr:acyl-CoA thioesterase [Candidatus Neomarinimicrobiota bacterium]|tara:strand:+ start:903 stop:1319 length:417 start_codon:yes stop_codon:yes gene_type:complete
MKMISYDHKVKVYYRDVDKMGIVYHSRYLEYFEESRTELLKSIGLSVTKIENTGIMLPVISSHCEYFKGAHFEQGLVIKSSISIFPKAKLDIDYSILCTQSSILHVKGYTTHAFVNKNNKPVRVPKIISDNLARLGLE